MRDIKFRLWCSNNKEWERGEWLIRQDGSLIEMKLGRAVPISNKNHLISQYTGLKDKNEIEIYEGDIVKTTGMIESVGKVIFKDCEFCIEVKPWYSKRPNYQRLKNKENYNDGKSSFEFDKTFEVLGNVYDSPNLLDELIELEK